MLNNLFRKHKNCLDSDIKCRATNNLALIIGVVSLLTYFLLIFRTMIIGGAYIPYDLERLLFVSILSFASFFLHVKGYKVIAKLTIVFSLLFFFLYYPLVVNIFSLDVSFLYPIFVILIGTITQLIFYFTRERFYYVSVMVILLLVMYFTSDIYDFLYPQFSLKDELTNNYFIVKLGYIVVFVIINYVLFFVLKKYKTSYRIIEKITEELNENNEVLNKQNFDLKELKEEVQLQNEELQTYLEEIRAQRDRIEEKNTDIIKSITYARKIQKSLIPQSKILYSFFDDFFILNKPKDILSGDFYWTTVYEDKVIVAVADCTGHGIPAALLSVLGISMLNEITLKYRNLTAGQILDKLKVGVITSLSHSQAEGSTKDGMDISLVVYDKSEMRIQFAGAFNPLVIIRNKELISIDADRMPIGLCEVSKSFKNHFLEVQRDDVIYLFSDGFADQFGGEKNKKIKRRKFKELLISTSSLPLPVQKEQFNIFFKKWKGQYEQVDDVLIMGLKV